ncbi:MAG: putative lipid II flippase FtsW [Clostridia bacterium]|nr:putative lipid II flippase FtsW [Clostridia bacterium]
MSEDKMRNVPQNKSNTPAARNVNRSASAGARTGRPMRAARAPLGNKEENTKNKRNKAEAEKRSVPEKVKALTKSEKKEIKNAEKDERWNEGIERVRSGHDWIFFIIVMLLISLGTVMVYSASYPSAIADGLGGFYYVGRQLFWIGIGLIAMLFLSFAPYKWVKKAALPIFIVTIALLAAVPVIGKTVNGAKRWIQITSQIRIQPSEIAKLAIVIILAWYVSNNADSFKNVEDKKKSFINGVFKPSIFIFLLAGLVLLEKHLSGALIIVLIGVILMFLAGANWKLMLPYYMGIGGVSAALYLFIQPYAWQRVVTFFSSNADKLDEDWQTYQGTLAIGSGGFLGLGLGQSRQKFSYVSEAQNDFIFTIWCEEMGFVGAIIVILLFVALVFRGYKIALRAPDTFSSLLVFGIITQVGLQAFLNLMVVTDIIPNTGISLPFLSYGGSSLVMMMAEMGIVLSISRRSYQKIQ